MYYKVYVGPTISIGSVVEPFENVMAVDFGPNRDEAYKFVEFMESNGLDTVIWASKPDEEES